MSYILEWIITHFFEIFIKKHFGWDEEAYQKIIHNEETFVFNRKSLWFLILKCVLFILMATSIVLCLAIFFIGLYHNGAIVFTRQGELVKYSDSAIYNSWVFLLFAVSFFFDLAEEVDEWMKKKTKIAWWNLLSSCLFPYFITLMLICFLRLILLFTLDDAADFLNFHKDLLAGSWLSYVLGVLELVLGIIDALMILNILVLLATHSHLKPEYFVKCIKLTPWWRRHLKKKGHKWAELCDESNFTTAIICQHPEFQRPQEFPAKAEDCDKMKW